MRFSLRVNKLLKMLFVICHGKFGPVARYIL